MTTAATHWSDLRGRFIDSAVQQGVRYEMRSVLGRGGMGTAYLAIRHAEGATSPVVVKVINPTASGEEGARAALAVQKEAVALGRLNERVPPTPYVVRLVDVGVLEMSVGRQSVAIPWIAVEYVHGGVDGTTLEERVERSVARSGHAFSVDRAARAVRSLMLGIDAVHEVGVIHRDLKPANILCCGFGVDEVLKIADFGIARPKGMTATYGSASLGTPGYAAPEQALDDHGPITTAVDIFAFGALVFYLLTGEDLFDGATVVETVLLSLNDNRRSILDGKYLCAELRMRPYACQVIDRAIAQATSGDQKARSPDASSVGRTVLAVLEDGPRSVRSSRALVQSVVDAAPARRAPQWLWSILSHPTGGRVARRAAWTADAHCLVPTNEGLEFWDGSSWRPVDMARIDRESLRFARTLGADAWLVGGAQGMLGIFRADAGLEAIETPSPDWEILICDGDPTDLMVAVALKPGSPPVLTAMTARRWVRSVLLPPDVQPNDVARIDDATWLVCGRYRSGAGFAAIYDPLQFRLEPLPTQPSALIAAASNVDRSLGLALGRSGALLTVSARNPQSGRIPGAPDCACAAIDVTGQTWAGTAGRLITRRMGSNWEVAWQGNWQVPFTSLHADVGIVHAMTVEGGIVEGRAVGSMN